MKLKLLFTATFLLTSFFISAQAVITTVQDVETFDLPAIPAVATADAGSFTDKGTYFQLRGTGSIPDPLGNITFNVATASGSVDGKLSFILKKFTSTALEVKVSVAGYDDEIFSFAAVAGDPAVNETHTIEFAQKVTFTDAPLNVTLDIDLKKETYGAVTVGQYFSVTINKTDAALSTDDFTKNTFSLYPNPVINSFQLNSKNIESVKLYSNTGSLIKTFNAEANYNISDLATGIYIVNIKTQSGSKSFRIVKNKNILID